MNLFGLASGLVLIHASQTGPAPASAPESAPAPATAPATAPAAEIITMPDGSRWSVDAEGNLTPVVDEARTVVVTGSRVRELAEKGAVKVETITSQDLVERGGRTLADALRDEAGVQVTSSLGSGKSVIMDGLDGKYVLVLVDGRPVYGRVNSELDFSRVNVNPETIDRIEIVRGPMSALYGSEALGGVINIITKQSREKLEANVGIETMVLAKELNQPNAPVETALTGYIGGRHDKFAGKATAVGVLARPYDVGKDGKTDSPGRSQGGLGAEAKFYATDRLSLTGYAEAQQVGLDAKVSADAPFSERMRDQNLALGIGLENSVGHDDTIKFDLRGDRFEHRFLRVTSAADQGERENLRTLSIQSQLRSELTYDAPLLRKLPFADRLDLVIGATGTTEEVARSDGAGTDTLSGNHGRITGALYSEVFYQPWDFVTLIPGLRVDGSSGGWEYDKLDAESHPINPHTTNLWAVGPKISTRLDGPWGLALRASYGEGFRVPSFEERFLYFDHSELGYVIWGNEFLKPEKSRGVRIGALASPNDRFSAEAEFYLDLLEDLIGIYGVGKNENGIDQYMYFNYARAYTSGINISAKAKRLADTVDVAVSYQYLINAVDAGMCPTENYYESYFCADVTSLPLRPAHSGNVRLSWTAPRTATRIYWVFAFMSERPVDAQTTLPAFGIASVGLRQPITEKAEVTALLDNVTNAYHPIYGPKPGRAFTLSVRASY